MGVQSTLEATMEVNSVLNRRREKTPWGWKGPPGRQGEGRGAGVGDAVRSAVCGARTSVEGGGRKRRSLVMRRALEKAMEAMGGRMGCVGTRESLRGTRCATQRGASRMDPCKRDGKAN